MYLTVFHRRSFCGLTSFVYCSHCKALTHRARIGLMASLFPREPPHFLSLSPWSTIILRNLSVHPQTIETEVYMCLWVTDTERARGYERQCDFLNEQMRICSSLSPQNIIRRCTFRWRWSICFGWWHHMSCSSLRRFSRRRNRCCICRLDNTSLRHIDGAYSNTCALCQNCSLNDFACHDD